MGSVKKGTLTNPHEWWKHMDFMKKIFWKRERKAYKAQIKQEVKDAVQK